MTGLAVSELLAPTLLAPLPLFLLEHAAAKSKPMSSKAAIRRVVVRGEAGFGTVPPDFVMRWRRTLGTSFAGPHDRPT